ncbi:MAG: SDR family NAD(P)-dependent oxidoreductase [Methanomicrobiales archaeon]
MLLQGKTAIITGCSRGIGRSILELFAQNGADIWACSRSSSDAYIRDLQELSERYSVRITPLVFDLADSDQVTRAMKQILSSKGPLDILVNNAGMVSKNALFQLTPMKTVKDVFEVNFFSHLLITQHILKTMTRQNSGSIINLASIAGIDGEPGQLEYVCSKAALIGATKKLSRELSFAHIRVNAIAPGIIETDMIETMAEDMMKRFMQQCSMRRRGTPSEIASVALFLASDLSSYVTGQVIRVDGGL